jgi:ABC-type nitrate/sulfonate/bicarbonate transport system substrate-binding protein
MPTLTAPAPSAAKKATAQTSSAPLDTWFTRCPTPSAFGIALQLGWLEKEFANEEQISFRALQSSSDPKVHHSHYAHTQPNSFRHGGNYPAIWAHSSGANTRVIGLSWRAGSHTILSLPGSGIKTAVDLKGKRLLLVRRPNEDIDFIYATALRTYEVALASVGLSLSDVKLVEHQVHRSLVSDRVQYGDRSLVTFSKDRRGGRGTENIWGLLNREADVIVGQENFIEALGLDVVFDSATLPFDQQANNPTPQTFAVNAELIENRPDFVARVYARALQAVDWARNNRSDAIRIVAREQNRSEYQTEETYGDQFQPTLELGLEPAHIAGLHQVKNFLFQHGIIKNNFDVDAWIDPRPLEAARAIVEERRKTPQYQAEIAPGGSAPFRSNLKSATCSS